ncbi:MAG TPA: zinc-binding dehydrogenase [Anaerolineae bacterium]
MPMPALQLVRPRAFAEVETPIPVLAAAGFPALLVRTLWASMCGSDIPKYTGNKRLQTYPLPPGAPMHECLGQVEESTSGEFVPGDIVVAVPEADRGLAQFFVARASKAVLLPPRLAARPESTLIQPLATVINGLDRLPDLTGRTIAVIGLGSIGLLFTWGLVHRGARRVVGIDPCAERCRVAERMGASQTWPVRSIELIHAVRQGAADWEAPDIVVEAVGHQTDTINDCFELVRREGTVLAFGVPDHNTYAIEYETFFRKNTHLIAAVTPDWRVYLEKARDAFQTGYTELAPLVTHRLSILDAGSAFGLYERHEGGIIKALLDASCWEAPTRAD